ncbi:cell division protein FtsW (lipid II flippase) [Trueperella bonasi]|uniref:Cell division protein FtsW (Lipid II flippase) n=1 Tax=Trueperella bonasi TaxID=312286 RepID=A0ABT9NG02_9ACTO|nr:FtsW/RodA/SpoVE family cell cycle protein [Trueperella bonasi]MDP9806327.1 cell division protein FtsW (lipid II flippase) [Trueperella bonasi]
MSVITQQESRSGRIREFILLVIAVGICLLGWVLVHHGVGTPEASELPENFPKIAGIAGAAVLIGHVIIRFVTPWADPVFYPSAVLLTGLGLVMIHRIDNTLIARGGSAEAGGQLMLAGVGLILMLVTIVAIRDHRKLRRITYISLIAGTVLLLLPMVPGLGRTIYGARIWINVAGFSYQPAELAKICFAIFLAGYLVSQRDNLALAGKKILGVQLPRARHFGPILVGWAASMAVLVLERDFGTAILFFGLFVAMLYVATERVSWLIIGGLLTAVGVYFIVQVMPHIQARFAIWLDPLSPELYDAQHGSYQIVQGWFGMASGGLFGTGLGHGYPAIASQSNSDMIIASFGEEIGLIGLLAMLSAYLVFITRALKTAIDLRDGFGKLLASGLGFTIGLQCFIVVGGVTGVIPLTGLAMPFLALGGSALLTNWIIVGLLLRMSDAARRPYVPASSPLPSISDDAESPASSAESPDSNDAKFADTSDDSDFEQDRYPTEVVR